MNRQLAFIKPFSLSVLSGGLMALPYLNANLFFIAWFAFVPLLVAIDNASSKNSFFLGLSFGLAFYPSATHWVVDVLMLSKGYDFQQSLLWAIVFWLYCSLLPTLMVLVFTVLKRRSQVSEFVLFPLSVITFYSCFPMLFPAQLGESQSRFLIALQATEFVGVYGLDGIIALTNIFAFRLIFPKARKQKKAYVLSPLLLILWFSYGVLAHEKWEKEITDWKEIKIGIVQPNDPPSLAKPGLYDGYSRAFPPELDMTARLVSAGARLVIWPEARYKAYFDQKHVQQAYKNEMAELDAYLLFQDIEKIEHDDHSINKFNTATMLNNEGELTRKYRKMKRVPFGEYVPLVSDMPILKSWVERFFGKFLNEMEKGQASTAFELDDLSIIPLICYETIFSDFVAEAAQSSSSKGILVGLSNNGWFGKTVQPYQHVQTSIIRAVENRMPLVHAVNNGPSIVVLPTGRVIFESDYHQSGGYLVNVPYAPSNGADVNHSQSTYQRHPYFFIYSLYGLMLGLIMWFVGPIPQIIRLLKGGRVEKTPNS